MTRPSTKPRGTVASFAAAARRLEAQGMKRPAMRGPAFCAPVPAGHAPRYVPIEQGGRYLDRLEAWAQLPAESGHGGGKYLGRRKHDGVMCHVFAVAVRR